MTARGLEIERNAARRKGMLGRVLELHATHPQWSAPEIAKALGVGREYVAKTASRQHIKLAPAPAGSVARERERCAKIAEKWNAPRIAADIREG